MIAVGRERWNALGRRERMALAAGAVLAALLLLWAWVFAPLGDARRALRAEAAANETALAWMRPAVRELAAAGGLRAESPSADGRSLLARVDAGARAAGLAGALVAVEPLGPERVRARFSAVAFDPLIAWLEAESAAGVRIEEMAFRRAGAAGHVDGQVLLRQERR